VRTLRVLLTLILFLGGCAPSKRTLEMPSNVAQPVLRCGDINEPPRVLTSALDAFEVTRLELWSYRAWACVQDVQHTFPSKWGGDVAKDRR
jgi:hypothetical protein